MNPSRRSFTRAAASAVMLSAASRQMGAQTAGVFRHGVASGDPLANRVMIWTRVTPVRQEDPVVVEWVVCADPEMRQTLQRGVTYTNALWDFTVKVDVTRLAPRTTYYYQFRCQGVESPTGRTRTLPTGALDRLRFAVVSCSNYPFGFFNAYRRIGNRLDLDFVAHLGDYIYEYGNGEYGDGSSIGRRPEPDREATVLSDYRARYAQYRTDPDLQEAHRQHPWIIVWDDHESANDAWVGGAENHAEGREGDWSARRAMATQAWFEWMPVRENPYLEGEIYRNFHFGDLMDLTMLDTRLEGRGRQIEGASAALADPGRRLISESQEAWLFQELTASRARGTRWRFIGQQVMMGQLLNPNGTPFNTDQWDGYPAARSRLLGHIAAAGLDNIVALTGDIHSSWANEISVNPFAGTRPQAVEFVCPAVTSPGIDDRAQATALQNQIGATHPHVKYVELFRRGYLLVDLTHERAQAEFYHMRTILSRSPEEDLGAVYLAPAGAPQLRAGSPSNPRASVPAGAP